MGTMFDTTDDPATVLAGLQVEAVAGYANGKFANYGAAARGFPKVHLLEVDVIGQQVGNAAISRRRYAVLGGRAVGQGASESGCRSPGRLLSGVKLGAVMQSLAGAGVSRNEVRLWTAHYTGQPHICSSACGYGVTGAADVTQWASADATGTVPSAYGKRNIDVSITADDFSGQASPVPAPPRFPGRSLSSRRS